ncbi:MAG: hypothetical protein DMG96_35510, partial [Acidobacteria bacterium]
AFFCCSRTGIVSSDFVAAVSPGRLPSASHDRAPGHVGRFVENQLHAPRTDRLHLYLFSRYATELNKPEQELVQEFSIVP